MLSGQFQQMAVGQFRGLLHKCRQTVHAQGVVEEAESDRTGPLQFGEGSSRSRHVGLQAGLNADANKSDFGERAGVHCGSPIFYTGEPGIGARMMDVSVMPERN